MNENTVRIYALIEACKARIESYKARNALSAYEGLPPFYTEDYFLSEASDMEAYAKQLLS